MKNLYKYNNKTVARKAYNDGETILVQTNKVSPHSVWMTPYAINKNDDMMYNFASTDFDTRVNSFEFHNCNYETGYYSSFYVDVHKVS